MGPGVVGTGKKVKLTIKTSGIDSGEAAEVVVTKVKDGSTLDTLQSKVKDDLITADWVAKGPGAEDEDQAWPVVYKAKCKGLETKAAPLTVYTDWVEVESLDKDGGVLKDAAFVVKVGSETTRVRNTGSKGLRKETGLPMGTPVVEWVKPYRLLEWVDDKGPKRKAKVEKVPTASLLWPKPKKAGHQQWVNLPEDAKKPEQGSKIKVKAKLKGGKKGDKVYFSVAYAKDLSARDTPARGFTGGISADWCKEGGLVAELKDDDGKKDGYAEAELELGLAGGDQVTVRVSGCEEWFDESVSITNWRKVYYQVTKPKPMKLHDLAAMRKTLADVFIEYEEYKKLDIATNESGIPAGSWMDGAEFGKKGQLLNVGDHNRDWFYGKFDDQKAPLGAHLIFCDKQYDGGKAGAWHEQELEFKLTSTEKAKKIKDPNRYDVFTKAIQDGASSFRSGTWKSLAPSGHPDHGKTGALTADAFKANPSQDQVVIRLTGDLAGRVGTGTPPTGKAATDAETKHPIQVKVKYLVARGPFLGEANGAHQLIVLSPNVKSFNHVLCHELGHALRQTVKKVASGLDAAKHGRHYTSHGHQGDHCADGVSKSDYDAKASFRGLGGTCIMFGEVSSTKDPPGPGKFCDRCRPFLRADGCQSLLAAAAAVMDKSADTEDDETEEEQEPPTYRVTLRLGDPNRLFDPEGTPAGRQQRMHALGLLYVRADERRFADRFSAAWDHWKEVVGDGTTDDAAAAALVDALKKELVSVVGREGEELALPAPGELSRLRLPGGFAFDPTQEAALDFPARHRHRFLTEDRFYAAEHRVGAVPLVAQVECQGEDGAWAPAPAGVRVHFQLVTPDPVPAGNAARSPDLRQDTRVQQDGRPAPHGPARYVQRQVEAEAAVADDPQVDNCPQARGGRRHGGATGADYFDTTARPGWNDGDQPFPVPAASSHRLAVVAATNDAGEAGVVFRPTRQGGDRFKVRAFVDPIGSRASDGTDGAAARAETGTFVVWRTLRISKYVSFDYPSGTAANARTAAGGALGTIDFEGLKLEFGRCYLDLVVERTAARKACRIGDATWRAAIRYARTHMPRQPRGTTVAYDRAVLFPDTNATAGLINMLMPAAYNTATGTATAVGAEWGTLLMSAQEHFLEYFSRRATSGLCVVQAPVGDTVTLASSGYLNTDPNASELSTSGIAFPARGCFLFYGSDGYRTGMPYDLNRNTLHEVGHCLFLPHQWTDRDAATGAVSGGVPPEHDYSDYCIMSYQRGTRNNFDYCGRCNLKLRGWDTSQLPLNNSRASW